MKLTNEGDRVKKMKCPIIDAHTRIICDENDFAGVREVAEWVRNDLRLVFGDRVSDSGEGTTILVGSLEKSDLLRVKREEGILSADGLRNEDGSIKREVYRVDLIKEGDADRIVIQGGRQTWHYVWAACCIGKLWSISAC